MKIAIHARNNSYSDRWIAYCKANAIDYKIVDCYASDIINQLADCDALMWHYHQTHPRDFLFARQLLFAVESSGKKVFPDFFTSWHFDDKVAQKYLLESLGTDLVPTHVFYHKEKAMEWAADTSYPKVFKLRGGAGSQNVRLVRDKAEARRLISTAFGKGFKQYDSLANLTERIRKYRLGKVSFTEVLKGVLRLFSPPEFSKLKGPDRGYIYFQDFIPGNDSDIRVVVVGDKAFALKRMVRANDFRASGSGEIVYEKEHFPDAVIDLSFRTSDRVRSQCIAIDFVKEDARWRIVEISFGFAPGAYDACVGYWDRSLNFYPGRFNPYGWMIEDLRTSDKNKSKQ